MSVSAGANFTSSCGNGQLVTDYAQIAHGGQIVLADRQKVACYLLGPALLTTSKVGSAEAVEGPPSAGWGVNVRFANDDFVTKVARGNVGKQIAVILNGVVQSAPTIQSGITGDDVFISGNYNEATARDIAGRIDPSSRSRTPETTP